MLMAHKGLAKLIEECGELQQIAAKQLGFPDTDTHPDGLGSMKERMAEEMADVLAAMKFVCWKFELDIEQMIDRSNRKFKLFRVWDEVDT